MGSVNRREFLKQSSLTFASLVTIPAISSSNLVVDATEPITTGEKISIKTGDSITYTNLPNQPIALLIYNNSGNNTEVIITYLSIRSTSLESVSQRGLSLGEVFLFNPSTTKTNEITVSIPRTEFKDSSVDIYCASLLLPTNLIGLTNFEMNRTAKYFKGFSRAYATPQLAWQNFSVEMGFFGFIGLLFEEDRVKVIGINVNTSEKVINHIKSKIYYNLKETGFNPEHITFYFTPATRYSKMFYGISKQMVFVSMSSAQTTKHCSISLAQL